MQRRRFLGCAIAVGVGGVGAVMPVRALAVGADVRRRLRFTIVFTNPTDRALERQLFWWYLPATLAPSQRLHVLQVSVAHSVQDDALGHRILALSFDRFAPLAQKIVTVTADVDMASETEIDAQARTKNLADRDAWLGAERFIESDAADIRALAAGLSRTTEIEGARAIYEWVRDNLHYAGFLADDLGALYGLQNRRGDCTEYADLVVALARANGIAARMVGGYVTERDIAPRPQEYHNWAQLYLEGAWRTVDAQKETWLSSSAQYVVFRIYRDAATNLVGQAHRYRIQGDLTAAF